MSKKRQTAVVEGRESWPERIADWRRSGLSVRQFCRRRRLTESAFYAWRRRLTAQSSSSADKAAATAMGSFVELSWPPGPVVGLELVLKSGATLRIPSGVQSATLGEVIAILQQAGLC